MKDKLIEKQKELIELMDRYFVAKTRPSLDELIEYGDLKSEIAVLKQQGEKTDEEKEPKEEIKKGNWIGSPTTNIMKGGRRVPDSGESGEEWMRNR